MLISVADQAVYFTIWGAPACCRGLPVRLHERSVATIRMSVQSPMASPARGFAGPR